MDVIKHYQNYTEEGRLTKDNAHEVEFITTIHFLEKLIGKKSKILELGSATGKYSLYLAEKGHDVTAVDLVPDHIEALVKKISNHEKDLNIQALIGNAINLEYFSDNSFDVILCLGPLYHLKNEVDRQMCFDEMERVVKSGGLVCVAYLNRFAGIAANLFAENLKPEVVNNLIDRGIEKNNPFYFSTAKEIEDLATSSNFKKLHNIGTDGISYILKNKVNEFNDDEFENWLHYHLKTCKEPTIIGYSMHGLYIGNK